MRQTISRFARSEVIREDVNGYQYHCSCECIELHNWTHFLSFLSVAVPLSTQNYQCYHQTTKYFATPCTYRPRIASTNMHALTDQKRECIKRCRNGKRAAARSPGKTSYLPCIRGSAQLLQTAAVKHIASRSGICNGPNRFA